MTLLQHPEPIRQVLAEAAAARGAIPCFCAENTYTMEGIFMGVGAAAEALGRDHLPVFVAVTGRYHGRQQLRHYTSLNSIEEGFRAVRADLERLGRAEGPFPRVQAIPSLDHGQPQADRDLIEQGRDFWGCVMFDASTASLTENMALTRDFVAAHREAFVIEGCVDARVFQCVNTVTTSSTLIRWRCRKKAKICRKLRFWIARSRIKMDRCKPTCRCVNRFELPVTGGGNALAKNCENGGGSNMKKSNAKTMAPTKSPRSRRDTLSSLRVHTQPPASVRTLGQYECGDMLVCYRQDGHTGVVGLSLLPASLEGRVMVRRETLAGNHEIDHFCGPPPRAYQVDSLMQVKLAGDAYPGGFSQGRTLRNAPVLQDLRLCAHDARRDGDMLTVTTRLAHAAGYELEHILAWRRGEPFVTVHTALHNRTAEPLAVELLSSFSLENITPFDHADAVGRLVLHRFRSTWSCEGRLSSTPVEELQLERSWSGHGVVCERFGQVGSLPVRGFFPRVIVEDAGARVCWGAQLACPGSWQLEVYRRDDAVALSGGLADREFGHWTKTLAPGERLVSPPAVISVARGDLDAVCARLNAAQQPAADAQPAVEQDLPIIFNEWCTSWGEPSEQNLLRIADRLAGTDVRYLVIDAGWYATPGVSWNESQGDWQPSAAHYPEGLRATAQAIRRRGLIPGLWFEFETVGALAEANRYHNHLLHRDGKTLVVDNRRFWDFRDPFTIDYLTEKVIGLLDEAEIGYLKVDYNETLGIGVDGAESLGEGLRQHLAAVQNFWRRIRRQLPNLVIENCSSGGHRLEPSMMALASMGSFSDAHETWDIPIIAANLQRLILPRQSQIWAVLRAHDTPRRLAYSLAATFLGRMCLSGEINDLTTEKWRQVQEAMALYRQVSPIIRDGVSRRWGPPVMSYRHPAGWQAVLRTLPDQAEALVVAHTFQQPTPVDIAIPLPEGDWRVKQALPGNMTELNVRNGTFTCVPGGAFDSCVAYLKHS